MAEESPVFTCLSIQRYLNEYCKHIQSTGFIGTHDRNTDTVVVARKTTPGTVPQCRLLLRNVRLIVFSLNLNYADETRLPGRCHDHCKIRKSLGSSHTNQVVTYTG